MKSIFFKLLFPTKSENQYFPDFDADGDGIISKEEFENGMNG